ncbi:MAG TPA: HAD hydrolase-like protein [Candidatus Limnocylindria bacterium]|nr:HAD hydrolase-like protein [Candidatus Limnocylindria bacterium]
MSDLTVLFDLDGTLTDSRAGITACIRHALEKLGRACPDDDALATYIGPPLRGTLSTLLDTRDAALIEEALAHYRTRYDDVGLFENRVYEGVPEMLDATARLAPAMFVATAKPVHAAVRIVGHFDLARHFRSVHGAEPGGRFDAKVDLLAHLLETGVIRAETSVMVGDRGSDISAAKINGIRSIGARWGYGERRELAGAGADLLCESPRALAACLRRLAG